VAAASIGDASCCDVAGACPLVGVICWGLLSVCTVIGLVEVDVVEGVRCTELSIAHDVLSVQLVGRDARHSGIPLE